MAAPARQLRRRRGCRSGRWWRTPGSSTWSRPGTRISSPSSALNATPENRLTWPRSARIQPFSDTTTVIGSRSTIASSIAASSCSRRFGEVGAALAERRLRPEGLADLLDLAGDRLPLLLLGAEQLLDCGLRSARSSLSSRPDLHLLELAQVAQPHVEDGVGLHVGELERLHQDGLRLVLVADDLDDLVEVEIGDEKPPRTSSRCSICAEPDAWSAAPAPRGGGRATRCSDLGEADHLRDAGPSPARSC